jgi:diguanylate cyclase (GGDEF)-like protein
MSAPLPLNETARLDALRRLNILDTLPEVSYDDLTHLAAFICSTPMASITLIDSDRQWFKSRVGMASTETSRSVSFCAHAILQDDLFVVPDAMRDLRFSKNPLVLGDPNIRFYAGMPITTTEGFTVGTICVIDRLPRELPEENRIALRVLGRQVAAHLQIRQQLEDLKLADARRSLIEQKLRVSQTRLRAANTRLRELATTDGLTGLGNRRAFDERLQHEWKLSMRLNRHLSLLLIDIDHFKRINDGYGHNVGDQILQMIARLLQSPRRETDMYARYGGEEFALLLPATTLDQAAVLANRLRERIAASDWQGHRVTVSIGVAAGMASVSDGTVCPLVGQADEALYAAKRAGRNRVKLFTKSDAKPQTGGLTL